MNLNQHFYYIFLKKQHKWSFTSDHSKNDEFVNAVSKTNIQQTISEIRKGSELLTSMEKDGKIKIVSAMYYLNGGKVEFEQHFI